MRASVGETPNSRCTRHASWVLCCMAVSSGPHTPDKRTAWKTSTSAVFIGSWALPGRTRSQTSKCWRQQVPSACTLCSVSVVCVGLDICAAWMMDASPKTLILYGELASRQRPIGRPMLRFKNACKRDMKLTDMDPNSWELIATSRG